MQFIVEVIESSTGSPHCLGVNHLNAMGCSELHEWNSEEFRRELPTPFFVD
ncbi:hypothetical protein SynRS9907_02046 [Synechococcus sp. RS9907]|nr:hypothetical protein SynRS9907_02046 [Synechococcus sp. RS9907]